MKPGINNLWSSSILIDKITDSDLLVRFSQEMISTIDIRNPPSDSANYDIIKEFGAIGSEFKKKIIDPAFNSYLQQSYNKSLSDFNDYDYRTWTKSAVNGYKIECHNHPPAIASGIFYLCFEEKTSGGEIVFLDPRDWPTHSIEYDRREIEFLPKTGDIIIFPSFMYHYTRVFTGVIRLMLSVDLIKQE